MFFAHPDKPLRQRLWGRREQRLPDGTRQVARGCAPAHTSRNA
ncbi:hypothetical protein BZL30_9273 [Mycobacterium kansasii]|uniref:Uncharacterized protein n=1 Tax=Mycobacterium kansasii TaxID=1768 RepID=A0A1V3WD75_MYCKA|nr:hypothetical protein BZL30_9273 [Mycobacterium kansasii]